MDSRLRGNDGVKLRLHLPLKLGEEVVALVVDDDESREVFDLDSPDRFHAEFFGYSTTSTLVMQSCAKRAAGPPMEPR